MECKQRDEYLGDLQTSGRLDALGKQALDDISASFQRRASYGIATDQLAGVRLQVGTQEPNPYYLFIRNPSGGGRYIAGSTRFYILNDDEWLLNNLNNSWVGAYNNNVAVISLRSSKIPGYSWCKNTLIHETLHSTSLYSRIYTIPGIIDLHRDLNEGITECLNGYVMFKRHQECYNAWRQSVRGRCAIAYKSSTKLFSALSQVIGIAPLVNFYFSDSVEFKSAWDQFLTEVHAAGFEEFNFPLTDQKAFRICNFTDECVKNINGFKKIYNSAFAVLDFSKIPLTVAVD